MNKEKKIRAAVVSYGNIGRYALEALEAASDFEIAGVVRRNPTVFTEELAKYKVVASLKELGDVDVAILCSPSREIETYAKEALSMGINTVDSYDIHTSVLKLKKELDSIAKANGAVAIISSGWDPGSDSVVRVLMEAMAPQGITYTNFGPGMSMGHTVAVKAFEGVKNALSMTIPLGTSIHRRMVYVELEEGVSFDDIVQKIKNDDYFVHDETHVFQVDDVSLLKDMGHGVSMERKGVSGATQNQRFSFGMHINNPALTAQILVSVARASMQQAAGAYTMIEIPPVDMLPGCRDKWIEKLY